MPRKRKTGQQVLSQIERMYNNPRMNESRRSLLESIYGATEERLANEGNRNRRTKTLNQALDQRNRIVRYYENTGRGKTAARIKRRTTGVGGVIGNMADRVAMQGGDPFTPEGMNIPISYRDRTTKVTDKEYNDAMRRNQLRARATRLSTPSPRLIAARAEAQRQKYSDAAQGNSGG